jgi:hypothetical protein
MTETSPKRKKKKKKKAPLSWEIPPLAKTDEDLNKLLGMIISFASVAKGTTKQKKYDVSYEFALRIEEVVDVVLTSMEELPPK